MDCVQHEKHCAELGQIHFSEKDVTAAIDALVKELHRALRLHPEWKRDPIHAAALVAEETGELVQAANDFYDSGLYEDWRHMRQEAVHSGAMALRFLLASKQWHTFANNSGGR